MSSLIVVDRSPLAVVQTALNRNAHQDHERDTWCVLSVMGSPHGFYSFILVVHRLDLSSRWWAALHLRWCRTRFRPAKATPLRQGGNRQEQRGWLRYRGARFVLVGQCHLTGPEFKPFFGRDLAKHHPHTGRTIGPGLGRDSGSANVVEDFRVGITEERSYVSTSLGSG